MPTGPVDPYHPPPARSPVDQGRLWAGGLASAVVVALLVLVLSWIVRDLLDIPALQPLTDERRFFEGDVVAHVAAVIALTLVATAVLDLLLLGTPTPLRFFAWLVALVTVVAILAPFTTDNDTDAKVAGAISSGVIGLTIYSLLSGVARRSVRPVRGAGW